jgi:CDGSH-type Zn-finger protein
MMEEQKKKKPQAIIEIVELGPIRITGNFLINDMKRGTETSPKEILLCRCGRSENKPFCDDSHKK